METLTQPSVQMAYQEHVNRLRFYRDELDTMRKKLSEIVKKNSSSGVLSRLDHFENNILIHEKVIVDLKHRIKSTGKNIELLGGNEKTIESEKEMKREVSDYEKTFNELRTEYIQFLSKCM